MKVFVTFNLPDEINLEEYKGFLTIDKFYTTDEEVGTKIDAEPRRFSWLKIKPLPNEMGKITLTERSQDTDMLLFQLKKNLYSEGWNDCLKVITE